MKNMKQKLQEGKYHFSELSMQPTTVPSIYVMH